MIYRALKARIIPSREFGLLDLRCQRLNLGCTGMVTKRAVKPSAQTQIEDSIK